MWWALKYFGRFLQSTNKNYYINDNKLIINFKNCKCLNENTFVFIIYFIH